MGGGGGGEGGEPTGFLYVLLNTPESLWVSMSNCKGGKGLWADKKRDCFNCFLVAFSVAYHPGNVVSVSLERIISDIMTSCHTEKETAGQSQCLTQSQYANVRHASPSSDLVTPSVLQGNDNHIDDNNNMNNNNSNNSNNSNTNNNNNNNNNNNDDDDDNNNNI